MTQGDGRAIRVVLDATAVHATSGGAGRYVRELLRHLPDAGVTPLVLVRRSGDRGVRDGPWELAAVAPRRRPLRLAWEQTSLLRAVRSRSPDADVLHSPHYTMPLVRRGARPARVVTVHDTTTFNRPGDHDRLKVALFRRAATVAASRADAVIVPTRAVADSLRELVDLRAPLHVVHHGVDTELFRSTAPPGVDDRAILDALGVRSPYVLHLGAIEPRKNVDVLCDAMEHLAADPDVPDGLALVLAGRPWRGAIERLPAPVRVPRHVLGFVDDAAVAALLRGAAAVAYPSSEEGFGLPVAEALACGAAVVTGDRGATAEVAAGAAVLVAPRDAEALASGLLRVLRHGLSGLAEPRIPTWSQCARAHVEVYRSVADR